MSYKDAGHRPHAVHTGELPENPITKGPESIRVTLDTWGPERNIFPVIYDALQSNWGDAPSRTVDNDYQLPYPIWPAELGDMARTTGWIDLTEQQRAYVDSCFAGRTLPQVLELLTFEFTIDGVSRAFTHQNVRTRVGAAFMQHGGRDNDWRHRAWTMPETILRAVTLFDHFQRTEQRVPRHDDYWARTEGAMKHCVTDWTPIEKFLENTPVFDGYEYSEKDGHRNPTLLSAIQHYLQQGRELYAALVDAGIPWQDARRVLWMGTQTYIHDIYNYVALQTMLGKRLEHIMDWEHNCVAQLMVREINMKCPPVFGKYLMSISDKTQRAAFAELESWPPDMKYDPNFPCECGHAKANHFSDEGGCEVCRNRPEGGAGKPLCVRFRSKDPLPRAHRPEQNPFFILHPDSMKGGPIVWVRTNGVYPEELRPHHHR